MHAVAAGGSHSYLRRIETALPCPKNLSSALSTEPGWGAQKQRAGGTHVTLRAAPAETLASVEAASLADTLDPSSMMRVSNTAEPAAIETRATRPGCNGCSAFGVGAQHRRNARAGRTKEACLYVAGGGHHVDEPNLESRRHGLHGHIQSDQ